MDLKQLILSSNDRAAVAVEVPEWGCTVRIGVMTGHQRNAWSSSAFDADGNVINDNLRSRLLVHCLQDEDGRPLFNESDMEQLEAKSSLVLQRLFAQAKKINGLEPQSVDDAEKNS